MTETVKYNPMTDQRVAKKDSDLTDILYMCSQSTKSVCQLLLPEYFPRPFTSGHDEIFEALDDPKKKRVLVVAPRGFGKSMILFAYILRCVLFVLKKFVMPIMNTEEASVEKTESLKFELENNAAINALFGSFKTKDFSKENWVTDTGVRMLPRGLNQPVRGRLFRYIRPDLIPVDDIEKPEGQGSVMSDTARLKIRKWFFNDMLNCVDRGYPYWKVPVVGTILHEDALVVELMESPLWHKVVLDICDDEMNSLWPDFISTDEVKELYQEAVRLDQADMFFREYRSKVISGAHARFKTEYMKWYNEEEEQLDKRNDIETAILCDPAKTLSNRSCFSSIVVVSLDRKKQKVYVRTVRSDKWTPDGLYDNLFDLASAYRVRNIGVEVTSLEEFIKQPLTNERERRGAFSVDFVWLRPRAREGGQSESKDTRINAMISYFRLGQVLFNADGSCIQLKRELLSHPYSKRKDSADALSYFIEMFELGERYMEQDPVGAFVDEDRELELEERALFREYGDEEDEEMWGDSFAPDLAPVGFKMPRWN